MESSWILFVLFLNFSQNIIAHLETTHPTKQTVRLERLKESLTHFTYEKILDYCFHYLMEKSPTDFYVVVKLMADLYYLWKMDLLAFYSNCHLKEQYTKMQTYVISIIYWKWINVVYLGQNVSFKWRWLVLECKIQISVISIIAVKRVGMRVDSCCFTPQSICFFTCIKMVISGMMERALENHDLLVYYNAGELTVYSPDPLVTLGTIIGKQVISGFLHHSRAEWLDLDGRHHYSNQS